MGNQLNIGADDKVAVYDTETRQTFRRHPVDAKEIVQNGDGRYMLGGPDVEMVGDAGRVRVPHDAVADYEAKGYSRAGSTMAEHLRANAGTNTGAGGDADDDDKDKDKDKDKDTGDGPYDFTKHTKQELLAFANDAKVESNGLSKEKLIEALDKVGYVPNKR